MTSLEHIMISYELRMTSLEHTFRQLRQTSASSCATQPRSRPRALFHADKCQSSRCAARPASSLSASPATRQHRSAGWTGWLNSSHMACWADRRTDIQTKTHTHTDTQTHSQHHYDIAFTCVGSTAVAKPVHYNVRRAHPDIRLNTFVHTQAASKISHRLASCEAGARLRGSSLSAAQTTSRQLWHLAKTPHAHCLRMTGDDTPAIYIYIYTYTYIYI